MKKAPLFNKILIANRGEIACRIIKTAARLGIQTVAVYSDADSNALHVNMADEAVYIGPSPASQSYLVQQNIINAALQTKAQAIHPGYGFLSENADFSQLCKQHNIIFIGPPASAIAAMGSKSAAKKIMGEAGVPLVPGYHGNNQLPEHLHEKADSIGYPVLLKAAAGGGGKGMRPAYSSEEFLPALEQAKRESMSSFGDDHMLIEKYLPLPRHIEVQVFCDQHGNGVYLGDRDCSIQRRHQKVVEEAPAPDLSEQTRKAMGQAAVKAAQAIHYEGAGTIEFLYEEGDGQPHFYFMEMNTRLQVEHPVTEKITGQDLVEWQLRIAAGDALPLSQAQIPSLGHAIEVRIYAEDTNDNFCPSTGQLHYLSQPEQSEQVRIDTGVVQGDIVSPFYDPMIAKLITWDHTRDASLARMRASLKQYKLAGVRNNVAFLQRILSLEAFAEAKLNTQFIDDYNQSLFAQSQQDLDKDTLLACLYLLLKQQQQADSLWLESGGWRLNQVPSQTLSLHIAGKDRRLVAKQVGKDKARYFDINLGKASYRVSGSLDGVKLKGNINGLVTQRLMVEHGDHIQFSCISDQGSTEFARVVADYGEQAVDIIGSLSAPMHGRIIEVLITPGDPVQKSQPLIVMEAMKMEHTIHAPHQGVVDAVYCQAHQLVDGGTTLLSLQDAKEQQ